MTSIREEESSKYNEEAHSEIQYPISRDLVLEFRV